MPIRYLVKEIQPWKVLGLKVGNSRECLGATPTTPKGGGVLQRAVEAYVCGNLPSGDEKPLFVPLELAGKPLTRFTNRKLGWVLGVSTDVRAWIMSCPAPV